MMYEFRPMTEEYGDVVVSWKTPFRYACFDVDNHETTLDDLISSDVFDSFIALTPDDELVGFAECTFIDEDDLRVGIALMPDYQGKGIGFDFVESAIEFLQDYYEYVEGTITTLLMPEDKHAIEIFERVGFTVTSEDDDYVELELVL
ncbi:MAG: GNAT family N-acetyltransferase [Clostridia bacterium]|nr:GNAT family N-acetyltransferase [Clostridia bacterium]